MNEQIEFSRVVLTDYLELKSAGAIAAIERKQVIAHATLSALAHHWPSRCEANLDVLLEATAEIKQVERSRWMTQRRIAIAKLARITE